MTLHDSSGAADFLAGGSPVSSQSSLPMVVTGRVAVVDGRTLWFPVDRIIVRLAGIDSCELVQWSFDPRGTSATAASLAPVPCGALAKAWLKRAIGNRPVRCDVLANGDPLEGNGVCKAGGRDLALEMLRVGWAKVSTTGRRGERYIRAQHSAMTARYGMWSTYVLDMQEWRQKAIDKTLGRKPQADINLLRDRNTEISPPFVDARRQPNDRTR
ncbi:thermonuclease family protein [Pararhizobium sp. PWRC1-1]|uniref:thermonuclease family protein n=1 Tax=Pararhizobium sp. PWRC1-1 TaxID=2804566 RepID=UPI003CEEECF1